MSDKTVTSAERTERTGDVVIIVVVFAVLFGYQLLVAVANLQQLPVGYEVMGVGEAVPYPLLIAGITLPVALFAAGLWTSRRLRLVPRAGVLLLAFALSAQLSLLLEEIQRHIASAALSGL